MSTTASTAYSLRDFSAPAEPTPVTTIAIIGAGRVGTALARGLVEAGYDVRVAGRRDPSDIALLVEVIAPGAKPQLAAEAVADADLVIVAVPLHRFDTLDMSQLEGKMVVDVMNYWEPIDGSLPQFDAVDNGTSSVVAARMAGAQVVKAFNHIGYHEIESDRSKPGTPERRALAVSSDHPTAAATVMAVIDRLGFDALFAGDLSSGVHLEAGGEVFGRRLTHAQLAQALSGK